MTGSNVPATSYCDIALPTYWSDKDTPETIAKIKEDNQVWIELCRK